MSRRKYSPDPHKSRLMATPLESHPFEHDPANDYLCKRCQRCRALHTKVEEVKL